MAEKEEDVFKPPEPPKDNTPETYKRGDGRGRLPLSDVRLFKAVLQKEGQTSPEDAVNIEKQIVELETPVVEANLRVLDKLLGFESVYPYESRDPRGRVESLQDFVSKLYRDETINPERKVWIRSLEDGVNWMNNSLSLLEGFSAGMPYNFGGTDRMQAELYDKPRRIPTMYNFAGTFSRETTVPITAQEARETKDIRETAVNFQNRFDKLQMSMTALTQYDPSKENFGIIDEKVSFMSFCNISECVAGGTEVSKKDVRKLTPGKMLLLSVVMNKSIQMESDGTMGSLLGKDRKFKEDKFLVPVDDCQVKERRFSNEDLIRTVNLDDVKRRFPKELLQWYTTVESPIEKDNYVATLMALIDTDALAQIDKVNMEAGKKETVGVILQLADDVIRKRNEIMKGTVVYDKEGKAYKVMSKLGHTDREFKYKLMEFVVKKGFVEGIGVGACSDMGWNFEWYKDEKGVLHRKAVTGSINQATDLYTPKFWLMHKALYDIKANRRAAIWPASVSGFRESYIENKRPDQKPDIPESVDKDPVLKDRLNKLFGEDHVWEQKVEGILKDRVKKYGFKINPTVVEILKDNLWYWETPYASHRDAYNKPTASERYLVNWPVFLPPKIDSVNMLTSFKFKENGIDKSVWEALCDGIDKSDIPWLSFKDHGYDWWLVNNQMMSRWLKEIVDLKDTEHDRDYQTFYGGLSGIKDLIQRDELGNRGLKISLKEKKILKTKDGNEVIFEEIPEPVLEVMVLPMLISLSLDKKWNVNSGKFSTDTSLQQAYKDEVSEWLVMCQYLPGEKPCKAKDKNGNTISWKFEGYNVTFMKMLWFYTNLVYRIGMDYGSDFTTDKTQTKTALTNDFV